jgi:hypothetical protein
MPPTTPPHFTPPSKYAQPAEVPTWAQQLWAPPPFVDLVSDNEEDDDV